MPTHEVRSFEELRDIVRELDPSEEQSFVLGDDTPLHEARRVWSLVTNIGGYGVLANFEVLAGKDVAFCFVNSKLDELRHLLDNSDTKLDELVDAADHLDAILAAGGPGVAPSYEPQAFQEATPCYLDTDELVADDDLEQHVNMMTALMLDASPGSPDPAGGYRSVASLTAREVREQRALSHLNYEILKLKRNVLANMRTEIAQGIVELEHKFLYAPTHLGCGSGDYDRFVSLPMLPADRKGQTW